MKELCDELIRRLQAEEAGGETGIALSPDTRAEVLALARGKTRGSARPAATRRPTMEPSAEPPRKVAPPAPAAEKPAPAPEKRASLVSSVLGTAKAGPPAPVVEGGLPPGAVLTGSKVEAISAIRRRVWEKFSVQPVLTLRKTMVFSVGNTDARLMLVGEAPGAEEERQYEPFVGPAGQLLTKMLAGMGISREEVYISNIVKFRPIKEEGKETGNRPPTPEEIAQFRDYIMEEVKVIQPELILALGATATKGLLQMDGAMKDLHGHFHDLEGTPVMVTYHPSWLLQYGSQANKRKVWEDLLLVMERLGLPISAKQRNHYLPKE